MFYLIEKEVIFEENPDDTPITFRFLENKFYLRLNFEEERLLINDFKTINIFTLDKIGENNYINKSKNNVKIQFSIKDDLTYLYFFDKYLKNKPFIGFCGVLRNNINKIYKYPYINGLLFNIYDVYVSQYNPLNQTQLKYIYRIENYVFIFDKDGELETLGTSNLRYPINYKTIINNYYFGLHNYKSAYLLLGKQKYVASITYLGTDNVVTERLRGVLVPLINEKKIIKNHFILDKMIDTTV
jgi:hypothetical protein